MPIDGNKLRKENWRLGKDSFKYESINKSAFKGSNHNDENGLSKQVLDEIKERVRGVHVSYKSGPQDAMTIQSYFQTNNDSSFKSIKRFETIDKNKTQEFRDRLSQSNFHMGKSPMHYSTTNHDNHLAMAATDTFNVINRRRIATKNNLTNYTIAGAEDKQNPRSNTIPQKLKVNPEVVSEFVKEMKTLHVHVGSGH